MTSSAFKHKTPKQILMNDKNITTLDSVHNEKQTEFNYIKTVIIPKLKIEHGEITKQLKHETMSIETQLEKKDRVLEIAKSINGYKKKIKDYYLNNNKYIFSYFENKQEISNNSHTNAAAADSKNTKTAAESHASTRANKAQLIKSFFKITEPAHNQEHNQQNQEHNQQNQEHNQDHDQQNQAHNQDHDQQNQAHKNAQDVRTRDQKQERPDQRQQMNFTAVQQYLYNNDYSNIDMDLYTYRTDVCTRCHHGEMVPIDSEGILVCNKCSNFIVYFVDNDKPSYKEPPKEACFYAYKRINHFREILAQFQAKETTQIDESIISAISHQLRKERLTLDQFTDSKAKEILKKLGYNKYYEHIPFIKDKLGIKPPVMSPELEETLCNLFMEIQRPYAKFCPDERVNFLNYYYTIYKLCELLNQRQFLPYFPMLKDREKRIEQDEIWKNICGELDWKFISTI